MKPFNENDFLDVFPAYDAALWPAAVTGVVHHWRDI
jgi:hypothetical protein